MTNVLIADAGLSIRNSLKDRLTYEQCNADTVESVEELVSKLEGSAYDMLLFDISLLNKGGIAEFLKFIKTVSPFTSVVVLSSTNSVEQAVQCIKAGAVDFLLKPIDLGRLLLTLKDIRSGGVEIERDSKQATKAQADRTVVRSNARMPRQMEEHFFEMIGESESIWQIKRMIDKVAPTESRVLITGSNGTGKELVARWLHEKSNRAKGAFIEVNCAAIPSELIESELFGHEKGSFTSAIKQHKGKFEQAHGGTLFLDEIGDMSLSAQSKMLRVLQQRRITRIGGDSDMEIDVRVVAATNKNLPQEIKNRTFREDLYHRLSVIEIKVPTLDDRRDDIPLLVEYFLDQICSEHKCERKFIEPECVEALKMKQWPGNIRQLRNIVERLTVLSEESITLEDVNMYVEHY